LVGEGHKRKENSEKKGLKIQRGEEKETARRKRRNRALVERGRKGLENRERERASSERG